GSPVGALRRPRLATARAAGGPGMSDATREMLLRAIVEEPDADDVRLIYADWLHDHGDRWLAEVDGLRSSTFRRGFVNELRLGRDAFVARAEEWLPITPAEWVIFRDRLRAQPPAEVVAAEVATLAACPGLAHVRRLSLAGHYLQDEHLAALLASPHLR